MIKYTIGIKTLTTEYPKSRKLLIDCIYHFYRDEEDDSDESSFDPMVSKARDAKIQNQLNKIKKTEEQKEQNLDSDMSDIDQSISDISETEMVAANILWEDKSKRTQSLPNNVREQGQDEGKDPKPWAKSYIHEEENKREPTTKKRSFKKNKITLQRARKAKSSVDNQPILISGGLLAIGHK